MPKTNAFSRDNGNNSMGFLDLHLTWLNQPVLTTSNPLFNTLTTTSDVVIGGNLTVYGSSSIISAETVEFQDNILLINSEETASGVSLNLAGIEIGRGTLSNFQAVYEESSDLYKIGEVGDLQAVATREDLPLNKGVMVYNESLGRLDSVDTLELPITMTAGVNPTNSTTGTLIISGGGGIASTGDIYTDSRYFIKGNDYSNYIGSNNDNDIIVNPGRNFIFQQQASTEIQIPTDVFLVFTDSTKKIYSDASDISIENNTGDVYISTQASGSVIIPENTYLEWNPDNRIRYNSVVGDLVLDSSGQFKINPVINSTVTTPSTNSTTGALILAGGISTSNTTDAVSATNGGTFTTPGGASIAKKLFVGDKIDVSSINTTTTQTSGQGINFRSRNRILTTTSTTDTLFNTFEGGQINLTSGSMTSASTVYISSSPSISGGGILANSYSLWINSGTTRLDDRMLLTSTVTSVNSASGALVISGGVGIDLSIDSVSSGIGNSLTVKGGVAVGKTLFVGAKVDIGDTALTIASHTQGTGISFRSRNRVITTTGNNDIAINTFEGATISNASTMGNGSTVYITGPPSIIGGGAITKTYALWVNSGSTRLDGIVLINDSTPSTSSTTGAVTLVGGVGVDLPTDAVSTTNGGSLTTRGGVAIGKKLFVGGSVTCDVGTGNQYYRLTNTALSRFSLGLSTAETGSNSGSNFVLSRYSDAGSFLDNPILVERSSGDVLFSSTTNSLSGSIGAVKVLGGISVSNTTDAVSSTNGGSFTTAGGAAIGKSLFVGETLNVTGTSNLAKTNINTSTGKLDVTGNNGIDVIVGNTATIRTTTGSVILDSDAGSIVLEGTSGVSIDSNSGISIDAAGVSNFSTTTGALTMSGIGANVSGNSGVVNVTGSNDINITSSASTVNIESFTGVNINTGNSSTTSIGNAGSEVIVGNNLTVSGNLLVLGDTTSINSSVTTIVDNSIVINSKPVGLSDGGYLIKRYQPPNNIGSGQVVLDTPKESGSFQAGSTLPGTLVLDAAASSVADFYIGWWIKVTSGSGVGQVRRIKTYDGTTKEAGIYIDSDNTENFEDGLNLTQAPDAGDSYDLFDCPFVSIYHSESTNEMRFACLPYDISSGTFNEPSSYMTIHAGNIITEGSFTTGSDTSINGILTVTKTDPRAMVVKKESGGDIFVIDTSQGNITMTNPINTIGSDVSLSFNQKDIVNTDQTYTQINSVIQNNIAGNLRSTLDFKVQKDIFGLTTFMSIRGGSSGLSYIDYTTSVDSVRILNTTPSTGANTGAFNVYGGISVNNTKDAVSATNGGACTILGGLSVDKSFFVGGKSYFVDSSKFSDNSNNVTQGSAGVSINGDLVLYNSTQNTIVFNTSGVNSPTDTVRSTGSKIVLSPNVSATTTDYAIGIETDSMWYSVPDTTNSHKFYLGTEEKVKIDSTGIVIAKDQDGISFFNPGSNNTGKIYQTLDSLRFVPHSSQQQGFLFRNSSDDNTVVSINPDGKTIIGLSDIIGSSEQKGAIFRVESLTFTDDITSTSGTTSKFVSTSFEQSTVSATNTLVTTTDSINTLITGAPIKGTNQTFTNAYSLFIAQGSDIASSGVINKAASLYIQGSPQGNITDSYSLLINSGNSRINDKIDFNSSTGVDLDSNDILQNSGDVSINGDLVFYNSTRNTILFRSTPTDSVGPSVTTRSLGTKIVLSPNVSATTVDHGLGVEPGANWYSVPSTSDSHKFYMGVDERLRITNSGIVLTPDSQESIIGVDTSDSTDNKGLLLQSFNGSGNASRGAYIKLYGNELNSGEVVISSGIVGSIKLQTNDADRLTILPTGQINVISTEETTGAGTGALRVPGGISVTKSISVGSEVILDFQQRYIYSSGTNDSLNVSSNTSSTAFTQRHFTKDGDSTDSNAIEIYSLGTNGNTTNSEYLRLSYESGSNVYSLKSQQSGTGVHRDLRLESGSSDITLKPNGNIETNGSITSNGPVSVTNTLEAVNSLGGGSLSTQGGASVAKNLIVGGDTTIEGAFSAGVSTPTITTNTLVNVSGSVTVLNTKLETNGNLKTLSVIFRMIPVSSETKTSFNFSVPSSTTFGTVYDVAFSINGFYDDSDPVNIENQMAFCKTGTTDATVSFTSGTGNHTIQLIAKYN